MTEEDVASFQPWSDAELEAASRRFCELRGQDPESMVSHSPPPNADGTVSMLLLCSPLWKLALPQVQHHLTMTEAIRSVRPLEDK